MSRECCVLRASRGKTAEENTKVALQEMKLIMYKAIARPQRLAAIHHVHSECAPKVTLQTRPLTRQGHACELGCPAYHGHDQKQPLVKETVVTGGSDCRENHAHDLKQKMRNGAEAQKRVRGSDAPQSSHRSQLRRWSSLPWSRYPRAARIFQRH